MFSVMDAAERYGVSRFTVNSWIASGQLAAIDVSPAQSRYHRYRITPEALAKFESSRASREGQIVTTPAETPVREFI